MRSSTLIRCVPVGALLALLLGLQAWQVHWLFFATPGVPSVPRTADGRLTPRADRSTTITQTFRLDADGLCGITVVPERRTDRIACTTVFEVAEVRTGVPTSTLVRTVAGPDALQSGAPFEMRFPPISPSDGRTYELSIHAPDCEVGQGPAFWTDRHDSYRDGTLRVAGVEQWGDLVFRANASRASRMARVLSIAPEWIPSLDSRWLGIPVLIALNGALLGLLIGLIRGFRGAPLRSPRLFPAIAVLCLVAVVLVWLYHVVGYFFLFDDFALLGQATHAPLGDIFTSPLFGFYRPLSFVFVRLEALVFGWSRPWGHALVSVLIHAVNALVVLFLFRWSGIGSRFAATAAVIFVVGPWAGEPVFWMSARFDLLAALGMVSALALGLVALQARSTWGCRAGLVGMLALALSALLAKETAVTLPLLLWIHATGFATLEDRSRRRLMSLCASLGLMVIACVAWRTSVLPGLGGTYGDYRELLKLARIPFNYFLDLKAIVLLPLPSPSNPAGLAAIVGLVYPFLVCGAPLLVWLAARSHGRQLVACIGCLFVALLPVIWLGVGEAGTSGRRFLYLPGVWVAAALALGVDVLATRLRAGTSRRNVLATAAVLTLVASYWVTSLMYQARMWSRATALARSTIEQFSSFADGDARPVHIRNLPSYCAEGPFIIKAYAFGYYYPKAAATPVRADATVVVCEDPAAPALAVFPDPFSTFGGAVEPSRLIDLAPPVPALPSAPRER